MTSRALALMSVVCAIPISARGEEDRLRWFKDHYVGFLGLSSATVLPLIGPAATGIGFSFEPGLRLGQAWSVGPYTRFANAFSLADYNFVRLSVGVQTAWTWRHIVVNGGAGLGSLGPRLVEFAGEIHTGKEAWTGPECLGGVALDLVQTETAALALRAEVGVQFLDDGRATWILVGPVGRFWRVP